MRLKAETRIGNRNNNWKGGVHDNGTGRLKQLTPDGSYQYIYRLVAESCLGRSLKPKEVVHHIDGDPRNNTPENLFLFRHNVAHRRWHNFLERHNLEPTLLQSNLTAPNIGV